MSASEQRVPVILDIGGEGRHPAAWNLNPRATKTFGPERGTAIPRHIAGRAEQIPLAAGSVDVVIVERTPLRPSALAEVRRVARPGATIILRHVIGPLGDPHRRALVELAGHVTRRMASIGNITVRETIIVLATPSTSQTEESRHAG